MPCGGIKKEKTEKYDTSDSRYALCTDFPSRNSLVHLKYSRLV